MTLDELITKLTELRDEEGVGGETLVLFAHQPHYPLQCDVSGPVLFGESAEEAEKLRMELQSIKFHAPEQDVSEMEAELERSEAGSLPIVYLLEGSSHPWHRDQELSPYARRDLWDR